MGSLMWWPLAAASLHIAEEFVFPGGFAEWDRGYRSAYRASITPRLHLVMNGLLILACVAVGSNGRTPSGVAAWLTLAALLASNAVFHLVGTIKTRSYSPGLVTGLLLYVPMAVVGYAHFLGAHEASAGTALAAAALGGSYHLWSGMAHARRARRAAPAIVLGILAIGVALQPTPATAASSPDRVAAMIETFMPWAIEGRDLPADPPRPAPALPHRSCGGRLDPQHLPETVYVSWDLFRGGAARGVQLEVRRQDQPCDPALAGGGRRCDRAHHGRDHPVRGTRVLPLGSAARWSGQADRRLLLGIGDRHVRVP